MFNYWTDRIIFKEKIEDELYPLLKSYLGTPVTPNTLDEVKEKVVAWMKDLDDIDTLFDCEIKIDVVKDVKQMADGNLTQIEVIQGITITPVDI